MKRVAKLALAASALAVALLGAALCLRPEAGPRASGPPSQEAYVWQRAWTGEVREAVAGRAGSFAGLAVLGAEVFFRDGRPEVARAKTDLAALAACGRPVGLALRVGPWRGPFRPDDELARLICNTSRELLSEARKAGLSPAELQIDFDCAERDLDGYVVWVGAVRREVAPVPVTITVLPCWLPRGAFARLAAACDGFVLQVHSLERPAGPDAPMTLCDPAAARRAVEQAGRFERPFRVALPTYGYLVAFDEAGRFAGLSAEGPAPDWGPRFRIRELRADPAAMAALVAGWTASRPAGMRGVIWYRLPADSDALNWRWPTLSAVMAGRAPEPRLAAEVRRPSPGLAEIDLVNSGEADAPLPPSVATAWRGERPVACDALGAYEPAEITGGGMKLRALPAAAFARLLPGERRMIGWLRLAADAEVTVSVTP